MIEAKELSRFYGELVAVENVDLEVADGEIFVLLGPNGAGKTTLVRMLMGLIKPTKGIAYVEGHDVAKDHEKIKAVTGYVPEGMGFYEYFNALEYLDLFGRLRQIPFHERKNKIDALIDFFQLKGAETRRIGTFSKGMLRRLTIAQSLLHDPLVLFLDEPTAGLDPESAASIRNLIMTMAEEKKRTFFICTHNLKEAEELAQKVAIIQSGRFAFYGDIETLKKRIFPSRMVEIVLKRDRPEVLRTLEQLESVRILSRDKNVLLLEVKDPVANNPEIVRTIVGNGGEIVYVRQKESSLEDAYLKIVGERDAVS